MSVPSTTVVLRWAHVGDIVLTTSALDALTRAWPSTRVLYAVNEGFADLVRHDPRVAGVLERRRGEGDRAFAARLRAAGAEALLDLQGGLRNTLLRSWSGVRRRAVFRRRPLSDELFVKLLRARPHRATMTIAARYHRAVEGLVGRPLPPGEMKLHVSEADRARAAELLRTAGIPEGAPLLGMSPGANFETKRWPADRWAELARRATAAGFRVVLTGSAKEAPLTAGVRAAEPSAVDLAGALTLGTLGAVIERCRAFGANDSGPMHMARALGVPTLAFFGSTDPRQFELVGHGHALQYAGDRLDCAPCSLWGLDRCPRGHFRCMLDLDVDGAWAALRPLLDKPRLPLVHG